MKGLTQNLLLLQFTAQAGMLGVGEPREGGLWSLLVLSPLLLIHTTHAGFTFHSLVHAKLSTCFCKHYCSAG